jgi:hypothetical protein
MTMLKKPSIELLDGSAASKAGLLNVLIGLYDGILSLQRAQLPDSIPGLQAITISTHAALRAQVGDVNATIGPRSCIVSGRTRPFDGGGGIYVWDAGSIAVDDDASIVQPTAIGLGKPGRWGRAVIW